MNFRLTFPVAPLEPAIQYSDKLLLSGSCFAEEIGALLQQHKFNTLMNPNGILFNPLSIAQSMQSYLDGKQYGKEDLFLHEDLWHSWDHHSRFSTPTPEETLRAINQSQTAASQRLKEADWLIITLGSAFVYQLKENNRIVANCHRVPDAAFYKRLLTADEIIAALDNMMHRLFFSNRKVNILFTVSPVRYVRDGVVENNLGKAVLLQAVHHLVNKFDRLFYFPAYELVIDDLRDYRFYKEDLVHPNDLAIRYVWDHFTAACLHPEGQALLAQVKDLLRARQHRPFNPQTPQHRQFLAAYLKKAQALAAAHPFLDLREELGYFDEQ
ncbi:GSCFA domain-containing protein [Chitinophaga sp. XS-30]|uniref:GSCFA domain-containing protein n=1 Tax=Chitinophaga sp. XS-30 TaxID=2604421 RepID=UPI0011DCC08C|nr:GSCFA domain-containing protein [Chitinophaga sp. XS-30]QEH41909.1 GSCFA domain-containing protein [Chitinophaga sp. XS-30]